MNSIAEKFPLTTYVLHMGFNSLFLRTGLSSLWQKSTNRDTPTWSTATPEDFAHFATISNFIALYNKSGFSHTHSYSNRRQTTLYTQSELMLQPPTRFIYFLSHPQSRLENFIDNFHSLAVKALWIFGNIAVAMVSIPAAVFAVVGDICGLFVDRLFKESREAQAQILRNQMVELENQEWERRNNLTHTLKTQIESLKDALESVDWTKNQQQGMNKDFYLRWIANILETPFVPRYGNFNREESYKKLLLYISTLPKLGEDQGAQASSNPKQSQRLQGSL